MIGKRITAGLLAALLVVSAIGVGFPSSALAAGSLDDNDSRATATAIDVGQTETGTIEQSDVDWHAVEVESGKSIFANLTLTTENEEDLKFELYNPDGERIGEGPNDLMVPGYHTMRMITGGTATGGDVAEQSGTYYVRVFPARDDFSEPTDYELTVETTELDGNDPNEQPNMATQIESDDTISGVLSGSDRDTYAIDLEKGETITVSADYDGRFTPYTYLVGPNASDVKLDPYLDREYALAREPIGREHEFTYTAKTTGTHFLRVNPYFESSTIVTFDEKASYEVSVDVSGEKDDDTSRANATEIDIGSLVTGTIESKNESDWYAVELEAGQGFTAKVEDMHRTNPEEELLFDVYDPSGNEIGEMPFADPRTAYRTSPASTSAFGGDVAEQSGTYYINVGGMEGEHSGGATGNYSLIVETDELDQYDPNEQPETATQIEAGETVSGTLTGYDRDVYALDLEQGETATVTSDTFALWVADPTIPDTVSGHYDFGNHTIHRDSSDGSVTFTANQTGTYYLKKVYPADSAGIGTFFESGSYEMSVNVSDQNSEQPSDDEETDDSESDDEETNETPDGTDSDTDTDDSNEESDNTSDESEQSDDTSDQSEQSDDMSDQSEQSDDTDEDTSSDSSDC